MNNRGLSLVGRGVCCILLLVCVVAVPARAHAQRNDQREVRARELFVLGKYADALEVYAKLYAETAHPTYLRNVGRCYQNLGEADKAIASFREYLRQVKGLSAEERGIVERYIREMQALKESRQAASPPPEPVAKAPPPAPEPRPARAASDSKALREQPQLVIRHGGEPPPPDTEARPRRTAAYIVGAVSVGALGLGAFFGVRALSKQQDSDALCSMNLCRGNGVALSQDAKTNARVSDVAVGAGLVGAGIATYLFLSSRPGAGASEPQARAGAVSRLRLAPQLGPNVAGLLADVSW